MPKSRNTRRQQRRRAGSPAEKAIQGFEEAPTDARASEGWQPVSDRKVRVGIVAHQSAARNGELLKIPQYTS